jgi:hypothetical protein
MSWLKVFLLLIPICFMIAVSTMRIEKACIVSHQNLTIRQNVLIDQAGELVRNSYAED